ncbi:3-isopropylmalate/(R)-2-methylmalate dehydratase small subunit [Clostridium acetobutylicum]|jgi:3-isopropylmalate/(R)-2-methylmalate dehydratase small subunit|uniref:3-isopropylmalate dehydratase small subunit n=1 Tax=Clostridium acetobutylicum (strain ATCC 824 / DSM 792 / JCM 1419 / IAM 19013 / LMG 5710 / NBRC 13948 / NRRL B-527 / VKM B-1787 / 2291 / W) TaxID=272562 RepID=LEUD_CLOAB|nr:MULTISPECIES: 3-isopropylmalate dehydratase small subunit [Clostridium]Q97EE1.1 RecName: Full=3-isopropylmalate dehydratase small subunit; AltName: Full=Alpha-IPM isomerase; Short=IPMI; AltName: Full=Isopropylmalate isomerase [Clostridium acetobutylicum ATCC 824]AAK81109.1 3-isopropylmalate dehydratase, small subunit [Clostridium acetobutylicum ATCC 824]ADZ22213.1 3-isopropylmalate dehydratase, small subunit [Clostridium acetobutylicum EA 2018]AEI33809.1 3-isopropylmalate dehydratase, small 
MKVNGDVLKYGDNIDTDVIIPARYLNTSVPEELAKHCMEDLDVDFLKKLKTGDIVVGGRNFGCGSSREHAPICIKAAGVSCVIAKSFARIFYRNSINIGFPILECEEAVNDASTGDKLEVDFIEGIIKNVTLNKEYKAQPFPDFMLKIMKNEGLTNCVKKGLF